MEIPACSLVQWLLEREFGEPALVVTPAGPNAGPHARPHGTVVQAPPGPGERAPRTVVLTSFQADAVARAGRILDERGGVLIADSVGLGKTMIALALVEAALQAGARRILVTSPAALRPHWWRPLRRVAREHGCSLIDRRGVPSRRPCIAWLSHAALSLGRWPAAIEPADLVVVDEAHAMRNPLTLRYRSLGALCRPARVVLLSATPVNNSLIDLYWQLRLFLGDDALADHGIADLRAAFRHAAPALRLVAPLDAAVAAVTVRRTRAILGTEAGPPDPASPPVTLRFPRRAPPLAVRYDMDAVVPGFFASLGARVEGLKLDPFRLRAAGGGAGRAPVELMRLGLLKRLESSAAAFASSVAALARFLDAFSGAARDGMLLEPAAHRATVACDADQLMLGHLGLRPLPRGEDRLGLASAAREDAVCCRELLALVRPILDDDPKRAALERLLTGRLVGPRVLVFTEFRATAIELWSRLRHRLRVALIHGGGARIGAAVAGRAETVARFAPVANGRPPPPEAERIDVLIATDVLAEGFNLQDAAHVVSYDLPWNPVRLIQRVGRIDRLGSIHDVVHAWSFLPARGLDALLGLLARVSAKLVAIRSLGAEPSVVDAAAAPSARWVQSAVTAEVSRDGPSARASAPGTGLAVVSGIAAADAGLFDAIEKETEGPFATIERARAAWMRGRSRPSQPGTPCAVRSGRTFSPAGPQHRRVWEPAVIVLPRPTGERRRRLVVIETSPAGSLRWIFVSEAGRAEEDRIGALAVLAEAGTAGHDPRTQARGTAANRACSLPPIDHGGLAVAAAIALGAVHLAELDGRLAARQRARRLRRVVLRALAGEPGGPDVALCDRADRVIERTSRGTRAGVERAVSTAVQAWRQLPSRSRRARPLLRRLESALNAGTGADARPGIVAGPRVIAILQLEPRPTCPPSPVSPAGSARRPSVAGDEPGVAGPGLRG